LNPRAGNKAAGDKYAVFGVAQRRSSGVDEVVVHGAVSDSDIAVVLNADVALQMQSSSIVMPWDFVKALEQLHKFAPRLP
jgi:hypothetical protein